MPENSRFGEIHHPQGFLADEGLEDFGDTQGLADQHEPAIFERAVLDLRLSPLQRHRDA